jgi:hypothetical protein
VIDENLAEVLDRRLPQAPQDTEEIADEKFAYYVRAFGVNPRD